MLPQCTRVSPLPEPLKQSYTAFDVELLKDVQSLLLADCWAIVLDEKVVYNAYRKRSLAECVHEDMTRLHLVDHMEDSVLVPVVRRGTLSIVQIYLFSASPTRIDLVYKPDLAMWYAFAWVQVQ